MFEKLRMATARGVTMANHPELMASVYGDKSSFMFEQPLPYGVYPPGTTSLDFNEWAVLVNRIANVMRKLGIEPGERVAIVPGNGAEVVALIIAACKVGAIAVPMNYMLRGNEIKHIVEDSGARVLFTDPEVFGTSIRDTDRFPTVQKWVMIGIAGEAPPPFESMDLLLEGAGDYCEPAAISADDVVGIFYTSGTTGFPKGSMVTSRGLLESQRRAALVLPLNKDDFGVLSLPLAHIFGFAISIMGSCAGVSG
jgi:acyl-CoA synthetase (AMP-forming)/AMP-acid ligase II